MRQIGILCAAALVALKENIGKLESDHKNARLLAGTVIAVLVWWRNFNFNFLRKQKLFWFNLTFLL